MVRCHRTSKKMLHTLELQDGVIFSLCSHAHQLFTLIYDLPPFLHVRGTPNRFIFVLFADAETVRSAFITLCYSIAIRWTTQFLAPTLCLDILRRDQCPVLNTWIFLTRCFKILVSIFSAEYIYLCEIWGSQGWSHYKYCLLDWTASHPRRQLASLSQNIPGQA